MVEAYYIKEKVFSDESCLSAECKSTTNKDLPLGHRFSIRIWATVRV